MLGLFLRSAKQMLGLFVRSAKQMLGFFLTELWGKKKIFRIK